MTWEEQLDGIRKGETIVSVHADGFPVLADKAPLFELCQLITALTEGYNRNVQKVNMMRKVVQANFKKEDKK